MSYSQVYTEEENTYSAPGPSHDGCSYYNQAKSEESYETYETLQQDEEREQHPHCCSSETQASYNGTHSGCDVYQSGSNEKYSGSYECISGTQESHSRSSLAASGSQEYNSGDGGEFAHPRCGVTKQPTTGMYRKKSFKKRKRPSPECRQSSGPYNGQLASDDEAKFMLNRDCKQNLSEGTPCPPQVPRPKARHCSLLDISSTSSSTDSDCTIDKNLRKCMKRTSDSCSQRPCERKSLQAKLQKLECTLELMYKKFKLHEDNIDEMQERLYLYEYGTPGTFLATLRFYIAILTCTVLPVLMVEGLYRMIYGRR